MTYNPEIHHRRSIRLPGYDYSQQGVYFVSICVNNQENLLGEIVSGEMRANLLGQAVQECWANLPDHYPGLILDAFTLMPNHVHGIMVLTDHEEFISTLNRAGLRPAPTNITPTNPAPIGPASTKRHSISEIVRAFKSFSARKINKMRKIPSAPFWQRNYYERIIRDERELEQKRAYIRDNPGQWATDEENREAITSRHM